MIQIGADGHPCYRLVLIVSHETDWRWGSTMIQADALTLNRLVLIVSHDTDWCWCSPMIQISADVLPWYRLVLIICHDTDWCWFLSHDSDAYWFSAMIKTGTGKILCSSVLYWKLVFDSTPTASRQIRVLNPMRTSTIFSHIVHNTAKKYI